MGFELDFLELLENLVLLEVLGFLVVLEVLEHLVLRVLLVSRDKRSSFKCIPPKGMEVSGD